MIPKDIKQSMRKMLESADMFVDSEQYIKNNLMKGLAVWIAVSVSMYIYSADYNWYAYPLAGFVFFIASQAFMLNNLIIKSTKKLGTVDDYIPDFLGLMASNIRSGITYERALMISSRKEFGPLAKEIDLSAKKIVSGKPFTEALLEMAMRVNSPKFSKTMRLIVEGLNSGGNLAELLEATAYDIRKFESLRKDMPSQLLSYALFIFAAATFGAPLLYAVASFLIGILFDVNSNLNINNSSVLGYLPAIGGRMSLSPEHITQFSLAAIIITCFFASLSAGSIFFKDERQGLVYFPLIALTAIGVFFGTQILLKIIFIGVSIN